MRRNILLEGLRRVIKAKKIWGRLPNVDIAIFDTLNGAYLARMLKGHSFFLIDLRGESYHIPTLLAACLQYLLCRKKIDISCLYFSRLILKLGAKICITNQDAHPIFYKLDKELPDIRFIAVQQGLKAEANLHIFSEISGDYFAFGKAYAKKLANNVANMYVCGSIKANMTHACDKKYPRICYISGFVGQDPKIKVLRNISYAEYTYPAVYSALKEIDNFCSRSGIELIIASKANREVTTEGRNHVFESEMTLYENVLGRKPPLVITDPYVLTRESEMTVCDYSTLGYETFGGSCKVAFINLISYFHRDKSLGFGWPLELPHQGPFWTNQNDPEYIHNMLKRVWHMSPSDWECLVAPYQDQLMHYDPDNSILLKHIDSILNHGTQPHYDN